MCEMQFSIQRPRFLILLLALEIQQMPDLPAIVTSNSAYQTFMSCNRKRYLAYEALNGTATRGWERQRMSLPLSTGVWCHRVAQGLLLMKGLANDWDSATNPSLVRLAGSLGAWCKEMGLEGQKIPTEASEAIVACVRGYQAEARERGLDLGLQMDGSLPEEKFVERTIEEQSALLEAFGWAFLRVRLPKLIGGYQEPITTGPESLVHGNLQGEYELVDVEREEYTLLSGDVGLQSRCDAVLRRKSDQRLFIYNLKTSGNPDKRWKDSFEVDAQLMTETLAVERRLGERVYGVIIDGFDKGMRVELDYTTLKERPKDGAEKWYGQRSRLIYGYKCEDIPGRPVLYDYEGTTRKGWGKFAVWQEQFAQAPVGMSPVEYWVNWLPVEQVEAAFITLPPIMRSDRAVESAVRQMVSVETRIRDMRTLIEDLPSDPNVLDRAFPQNFKSCVYPSRCGFYELCHGSAGDDPASNGFQPRTSNHPVLEGGE
jgi:hypothetical protein